jgi:hypothetical protein
MLVENAKMFYFTNLLSSGMNKRVFMGGTKRCFWLALGASLLGRYM